MVALIAGSTAVHAGTLYISKLSAASENPPTASTATGIGILILNDAETQATITATHDISIPVTGGHIHRGAIGVNGPVIFPFPAPTSPVGPLTWAIPAADVVNLKTLGLYMNFHTAVNPGGAIRGPLVRALLAPAATTAAQMRVADALDVSAGYDADLNQILIQTNLASTTVQATTLDDLSARTVYVQTRQEIEAMNGQADGLLAHAAAVREGAAPDSGKTGAFFRGGNGFGKRSNDANQAGSSSSRPFVLAGVDWRLSDNCRGGLALGYADARDTFDAGLGKTKTKTTSLHAFLSDELGDTGVVVDAVAGYGWSDVNSTRVIPSLARTAVAMPTGNAWAVTLKASKVMALGNSTLIPYAMLDRQEGSVDAYTEVSAASVGLMIPKRDTANSAIEGGATLVHRVQAGPGNLTFRLQAGWHYLLEDGGETFAAHLVGSPVAFGTVVAGPGRSAAHVEASLTHVNAGGLMASLGYRGLLGASGMTIHAVEVSFSWKL
jgi:hypothetical protein